jgi:hypothetical protein
MEQILTRGIALIFGKKLLIQRIYIGKYVQTGKKNSIELEINGTTLKEVLIEALKILIPISCSEEQSKNFNYFKSHSDKLSVLEDKKPTHQELNKALMQQLLTGKIRVTI